MSPAPDTAPPADALADIRAAHEARSLRQKAAVSSVVRLVATAAAIALGLRTFVYEPFNIPSESMLPRLMIGDYLFVAKWPYGYGRYSLPLGLPLFEGRIAGSLPARGDIIVFKTPRDNRTDYIKRVIGLPGDTIAMTGGQILLNGKLVPKQRIDDFSMSASPDGCDSGPGRPDFRTRDAAGASICRYPTFAETLPNGRSFDVIDQIANDTRDDTPAVTVPAGNVFVLGDNRDDSADSRFSIAEGGVGMVPVGNIIGRADRIFFSVVPGKRLAWRRGRIGQPL